jgi:MFS family permease
VSRIDPALLVVVSGVSAALHVGKLPAALPALQASLSVTLVQAGFLLSLVQLAGMVLGLAVGLAADSWGLRRSMVTGLLVLGAAGMTGGFATSAPDLLALRAIEGFGFLLASMPAPSLIRRLVAPARLSVVLGWWGAYMPLGTALALLAGPLVISWTGWQGWWWAVAAGSIGMAASMLAFVPADPRRNQAAAEAEDGRWTQRLRATLQAPGPWLVAGCFAMYSGQWLAVIGFLPSIYVQAGVAGSLTAVLTATAAAVNMVGNIAAGRLLQRGVPAQRLLTTGFLVMATGSIVAFAWQSEVPAYVRYGAVLAFSMTGGMIPGTLFTQAVRLAPGDSTVSTTVGWMQQCSALGQFAGPPLVAWAASQTGSWRWTWLVTGVCSIAGIVLARWLGRLPASR